MKTNNLGMRRDGDVARAKAPGIKRILVVGDSHLDGVVHNEENFCTLLEGFLNARHPGPGAFQVLNVATGYYGPDNYAAVLAAYGDLSPDFLIVGFYAGNDFLDAVDAVVEQRPTPLARPSGYRSRLRQASKSHDGAVAQFLNQAFFFTTFPSLIEPALDRVQKVFADLNQEAVKRNLGLSVLMIPTKFDVEPQIEVPGSFDAVTLLGLRAEDLQRSSRMRTQLVSRLKEAGVDAWDPTDWLDASTEELYWQKDFHLNHVGHRLLAEYAVCALF